MPLVDVGGGQKSNLLPAELCEILPDQPFRGKLTDEHTAQMITVAAKPPNVNARSIVGPGLDELGFRPSASPQLNAFGISIGNEMTVVPGRILPPPGIKYGQGTPAVDERASWNLRNVKFAKGTRLENWAVLVILDGNRDEFSGTTDPELKATWQGFAKMCKDSGMAVDAKEPAILSARLPPKTHTDPTRAQAVSAIRTALTSHKPKPSIVLVILSNGDKHVYNGVKHLCDCYLDLSEFHNEQQSQSFIYIIPHNSDCMRAFGEDSQGKRSVDVIVVDPLLTPLQGSYSISPMLPSSLI